MKINKQLQKIADASVAYKIRAIEEYLDDLSSFDLKSLKKTIMDQRRRGGAMKATFG